MGGLQGQDGLVGRKIILPAQVCVVHVIAEANEETGVVLFVTSIDQQLEIVFLGGFAFVQVVEPQLVERRIMVQAVHNRPEFPVSSQMVRLLLDLGQVQFVLFLDAFVHLGVGRRGQGTG